MSGTVTDAATGEPLPGAAVRVAGTTVGGAADLDGRYRIPNAPTGAVTLVASYVGYETDSVAVVVPRGGVVQDFALNLAAVQGGEVVVSAQAEGQLAAINQQISSNTIVTVVDAARLQELPDANAAEAIGRLPGVSITRSGGEASQVAVRGLGPAYTNVTVNGVNLPATNDNRSTDINSVAPELLSGVEVYKVLRPDLDADAIGGTVNFRLRNAPDGTRADLRAQTGYNGLREDFGQYKVSASGSRRFADGRLGVVLQGSGEQANRAVDRIDPFWNNDREGQDLTLSRLGLGRQDETRGRLGGTAIVDYQLPRDSRVQLVTFASFLRNDAEGTVTQYGLNGGQIDYNTSERTSRTSILSNTLFGEFNGLPLGAQLSAAFSRGVAVERVPEDLTFRFRQYQSFPGVSVYPRFGADSLAGFVPFIQDNPTGVRIEDSEFETSRRSERNLLGQVDLQVPFRLGGLVSGFVKTGGKVRSVDRTSDPNAAFLRFTAGYGRDSLRARFPERTFMLTPVGEYSIVNWLPDGFERGGDIGLPSGTFPLGYTPDRAALHEIRDRLSDVYRDDFLGNLNDFTVSERVSAGYGMAEVTVGPVLVVGGLRYEHTSNEYQARNGVLLNDFEQAGIVNDTTSTTSYGDWLPQVQLRYKPVEWFDLRLARTESIRRPPHGQASPRLRRDDTDAELNRGNPSLRPERGTSYDAFATFNSNRLGLFTVGGFVKQVDDGIYQRSIRLLSVADAEAEGLDALFRGYQLQDYANLDERAYLRGVEVDWQTRFSYLPRPFNGLLLNANATRMWSEASYPRSFIERATTPPFALTRRDTLLVDRVTTQADWLANVSLGYDVGGFSGRASMQYQGDKLDGIANDERFNSRTGSYLRWDLRLQQRLGAARVFFNLNNITDRPDTGYQSSFVLLGYERRYGWSADLGLRYQL